MPTGTKCPKGTVVMPYPALLTQIAKSYQTRSSGPYTMWKDGTWAANSTSSAHHGHIWARSEPKTTRTGPYPGHSSFLFWGLDRTQTLLTCGHGMTCLWLRSCKHEWPLLHVVCRPDEHVWFGPDPGQQQFFLIWDQATVMVLLDYHKIWHLHFSHEL